MFGGQKGLPTGRWSTGRQGAAPSAKEQPFGQEGDRRRLWRIVSMGGCGDAEETPDELVSARHRGSLDIFAEDTTRHFERPIER